MLHSIIRKQPQVLQKFIPDSRDPLKPLDYKVKRTNQGARTLSIMHPLVQVEVSKFYETYKDLMLYYCSKSPCSLRAPVKIAHTFKSKPWNSDAPSSHGIEEEGKYSKLCSSYFTYGKYSFLYRFYESYEYHALEKKFRTFTQVDVAKCFHGIYTHSLSWAIKNRRIAKRDKSKTGGFDREFDRLIQRSNYLETNGIIVGPELSRIFAEVILQEIDIRVINRLEKIGHKRGHDFDFRRYVDDFLIFTNRKEILDVLLETLEEELAFFKLYLNNAKTKTLSRPFITSISLFKEDFSRNINEIQYSRFNDDETVKQVINPSRVANKLITSIKSIVKKHDIGYSSVSNYLLSIIQRKINTFIKRLEQNKKNGICPSSGLNWLMIDIDLMFFVHAMDPRVVPTDKIAKTIKLIIDASENFFPDRADILHKKIFDLGRKSIEIFNDNNSQNYSIEILNLLLVLSQLKENLRLTSKFITTNFSDKTNLTQDPNYESAGGFYFLWVSVMKYISDDQQYTEIRKSLVLAAKSYIQLCPIGLKSSETFLFFFDFISCPFVEDSLKAELAEDIIAKENLNINKKNLLRDYSTQGFVVNWSESSWFQKSLLKRDYHLAYE